MAERVVHFGLTLTGNALKEYEDYYWRLKASIQDDLSWGQWNVEIYRQGMLVMSEAIKQVENENKLC